MAGRTIKGQVAFVSTGLLSVLNLLATIGGIAAIVVICALEHVPSRMGWLFIILGDFRVVPGLIGLCTSNHWGCFTWQAVLLMFALIGLISASLLIFFKPTQVLARMNSKYSESTSWKIIKFQAAIFFIVFCIDVSAITHYISQWGVVAISHRGLCPHWCCNPIAFAVMNMVGIKVLTCDLECCGFVI